MRIGGEVEIESRLESKQRVPHDAADQRQLMTGFGECGSQPLDHLGVSRLKHDRHGRLTWNRNGHRVGSSDWIV